MTLFLLFCLDVSEFTQHRESQVGFRVADWCDRRTEAAEDLVRSFSGEAGDSCYKTMPTANAGKIVKNHRCPHCDASYNSLLCTKANLTQFRAVRTPRTTQNQSYRPTPSRSNF